MKNILNDKPSEQLNGRLAYSINFVDSSDMREKRILNIGCGFGWFELFAINNSVEKICSIEITESDLKTAKNNINDPRVEFKVGSAIELPFPDNYFDTVVSWEVIEHIPYNTENLMYREVSRVLKEGGHFYLSTPFNHIISNIFDPAWWLINHRHYSLKQLSEFGQVYKLEVVNHDIKGGLWTTFAVLNMYISKWIFKRKPFFETTFSKLSTSEYLATKSGFYNIFVKYIKGT